MKGRVLATKLYFCIIIEKILWTTQLPISLVLRNPFSFLLSFLNNYVDWRIEKRKKGEKITNQRTKFECKSNHHLAIIFANESAFSRATWHYSWWPAIINYRDSPMKIFFSLKQQNANPEFTYKRFYKYEYALFIYANVCHLWKEKRGKTFKKYCIGDH